MSDLRSGTMKGMREPLTRWLQLMSLNEGDNYDRAAAALTAAKELADAVEVPIRDEDQSGKTALDLMPQKYASAIRRTLAAFRAAGG